MVGGNAAGMSAASKAKRRDPDLEVTVLEAGLNISYSSCGIPAYVEGVVEDPTELLVLTKEKAAERGIAVRTRTRATGFNAYTKRVSTVGPEGKDDIGYDKLLLAMGTHALNPFTGGDLPGVFTVRHIADGVRLMRYLEENKVKKVAVVGGGFVGLEMAEALQKQGAKVHLYQRSERLLTSFDPDMTAGLEGLLQQSGIQVHLGAKVKGFAAREPRKDGKETEPRVGAIEADKDQDIDCAVVAVGVAPSTEWAVKAGVESTREGFLVVDTQMKTNIHDVYAAGDCVAPVHAVTERPTPMPLALAANRMGKVAGDNIAASLKDIPSAALHFPGTLGTAITRVFGLAIATTGLTEQQAKASDFDLVTHLVESKTKAGYMPDAGDMAVKLVANADNGRLIGAQLVGPAEAGLRINAAAVAVKAKLTAKQFSEVETAYSPHFSPVYDPFVVCAWELAKKLRK